MLHLHRFHDEHLLTGANLRAGLDRERNDGALQRRAQGRGAIGRFGFGGIRLFALFLAVMQNGKRIGGIHLRTRALGGFGWLEEQSLMILIALCQERRDIVFDEASVRRLIQFGVQQDVLQERNVRGNAPDLEFA